MSNENHIPTGDDHASDPGEAFGAESDFVVSEEKKSQAGNFAVLGVLILVAAGVVYFMFLRSGPSTAQAAPETDSARQTVTSFLDSGPSGIRLMEQMLKDTEKVVKQFLDYPSMAQVPLSDLRTNPFRLSVTEVPDSDAVAQRKREEERQAVLRAVRTLQLQSIITGTRNACMINNTLYQEGQQVGQFTIEQISAGSVIVRSGSYRFELKMQQ